jgi:AcrR family transcriptional regulator
LLFQKLVNYIRSMTRSSGAALAAPSAEKDVLRKLKPGPGLSREAVAMDQKLRLRIALTSLVSESGYDAVTVRALIRRANVSTSTFYNHYGSVEGCFAAIAGEAVRAAAADIREGRELEGDAIRGLRRAVQVIMNRMAHEPQVAQAVFIESFGAGPKVRGEMATALSELEAQLAETFDLAPRPTVGTTHLAAGLVAGVVGIIRRTTLMDRADELSAMADELTDWMLSVAHEEVATFRAQKARSGFEPVGVRLPWIGAEPALRESIADPSHRAIMTTARLAAPAGLDGLTSAQIRRDAGLSRREFERHFTGVEECFLEAIASVSTMAAQVANLCATDARSWERRIFRTMTMLCALAAGDRDLCRLVLLDITAAGRPGLLRREDLISQAAAHICSEAPAEKRPSELGAVASVCAVWRIAETEVSVRRAAELPLVARAFVYVILAAGRRQDRTGSEAAAALDGEAPVS